MKIFQGWREVGRAMRWARQQDGVDVKRDRIETTGQLLFAWYAGNRTAVYVSFFPASDPADVAFEVPGAYISRSTFDDAATALRVLAALDLIPAELAEATS